MDRYKFYCDLMKSGCSVRCRDGLEKHHIVPKSIFNDEKARKFLGGEMRDVESEENIVYLEQRKHYLAHRVLPSILKEVSTNSYEKMLYALIFMGSRANGSRGYSLWRLKFAQMMSDKMKGKPSRAKGCKWSEESKKKKSETNPLRGKTYEEVFGKEKAEELKKGRSKAHKGKVVSKETKEKLSKVKRTKEWNKKNSKANKGRKLSKELIERTTAHMKDDKINPHVNQTVFIFKNKNTQEVIHCRMVDLRKREGGCSNPTCIVKGNKKSLNGWTFLGESNGKT